MDLREAVDTGELEVYFQPILSLATKKIIKAEALLRWNHPVKGQIEPQSFIPVAEESGLIHEIGDWVILEAAKHSVRWEEQLGECFPISVNISPVQLHQGSDKRNWADELVNIGINPSCISLEVTEGVLLNASQSVTAILQSYRDIGIEVALDDFGTGYSSMSYLQKFSIDYLKIDQSFIKVITSNNSSRTIVETMIVMAHKLGLKVIAEGIETEDQLEVLLDADCDYGQGYLFSEAVEASKFEQLLKLH